MPDIKAFCEVMNTAMRTFNWRGIAKWRMAQYLKQMTNALDLQTNPDWYKLCLVWDKKDVNKYVKPSKKAMLMINGKSLLTWDENDITEQDLFVAIDSAVYNRLTYPQVKKTAKLRNKVTNKLLTKLIGTHGQYTIDIRWLNFWDSTKANFGNRMKLKTLKDWFDFFSITHRLEKRMLPKETTKLIAALKKVNAPKKVFTIIDAAIDYRNRYGSVITNQDYHNRSKTFVPAFVDEHEQAEFEVYLKMINCMYLKVETNVGAQTDSMYTNNLACLINYLLVKLT